jgi:hypothetical protein
MRGWELAIQMSRVIQASGGYTNDQTMKKNCEVCGKMVRGEKEAEAHGKITRHCKFSPPRL